MKKYLLLIACVFLSFFYLANKNVNYKQNDLYNVLKTIDYGPLDKEKLLYINVGIDYVPYELIELFEQLTGINVIVDVFDSNEILEAKLLAGGAQYDLVFPTAWPNFSRQLNTNIYRKIDKSKVDFNNFDRDILEKLAIYDVDNSYCIPYQFGISGIGINEKIVNDLMTDPPKDSLALIFDPKNAEKLSKYRISLYESPNELFPAVLAYLGLDPESDSEDDIKKAAEHLKKIRKHISKFTSFGFEDLASGNACVTLSTSGDVFKVQKFNNKPYIKFFYPKEGAALWVDVIAIPSGAKHIKNVYAFLKFLFHPQVIAKVTNITFRANAVLAANRYVDKSLINNKDIYPTSSMRKKCYIERPLSSNVESLKTRLLTKIKSIGK